MSGGRGQRKVIKAGRPPGESSKSVVHHLKKVAPSSFLPPEDREPHCEDSTLTEKLSCPICLRLLDRPVELTCGSIVCLECCQNWIQYHLCSSLVCPCCIGCLLDSTHIRAPPCLILSLLEGLHIHCMRKCGKVVRIDSYTKHLKGQCRSHYVQLVDSPSRMTIREVLSKPTESPATPAELRMAEHLVRKICTEGVMKVPTRGQVSEIYIKKHKSFQYKIAHHLGPSWWL